MAARACRAGCSSRSSAERRGGSPLSYARPLDILFSKGLALPQGAKALDFGHGYIGHLRLLATMGVDATGVDVDPLLTALYGEPGD